MAFDECLRINMSEHECAVNLGSNHTLRSVHLSHQEHPEVTRSSGAVRPFLPALHNVLKTSNFSTA